MCVDCDDVITNPVCSECLAVKMQVMVGEYDKELAASISGFHLEGSSTCLFCSKSMALCAHCFSKDVYEQIHDSNPLIAEEFVRQFDFNLREVLL